MTNPLQQIASAGLTEQVDLSSLDDIKAALLNQIVFCDTSKAVGIPVRKIRKFRQENIPQDLPAKSQGFLDYATQGLRLGYEVYTLEGWTVPERVYYVKRKE